MNEVEGVVERGAVSVKGELVGLVSVNVKCVGCVYGLRNVMVRSAECAMNDRNEVVGSGVRGAKPRHYNNTTEQRQTRKER